MMPRLAEVHPDLPLARAVRRMRPLRRLRGWGSLVHRLVPESACGPFTIRNGSVAFTGDLGSHVDRHTYLFGQYEAEAIDLFLGLVPESRRRVVLDVGANVGTHSAAFASRFERVHAFEPNPGLWPRHAENMRLNGFTNVTLHRIGLSDADAELEFHLIDAPNLGLGTFSRQEQYRLPLRRAGSARVVRGDDWLAALDKAEVDAVKVDVQGFEPNVLRGLRGTLERSRPLVWCEVGSGTRGTVADAAEIRSLFPYPVRMWRIEEIPALLWWRTRLVEVDPAVSTSLPLGDYFFAPA